MVLDSDSSPRLAPLTGPIYLTALLLIVVSFADYFSAVWPFRLGEVSWRYGAVGLFSGFMLTPLLGFMVAIGFATMRGHRGIAAAVSIASVILAVGLALGLVTFSLDALQVRREVAVEAKGVVDAGIAKAALKHLAAIAGFGAAGIGGLRATRRVKPVSGTDRELVVGRGR